MTNFADRLISEIKRKGTSATIALDPVYEQLPGPLRSGGDQATALQRLSAITEFSRRVIRLIAPLVPVVKINSAYFEIYHGPGVTAYHYLVRDATDQGLLVIGDVKRGDVGHTAKMYAEAQLAKAAHGDHAATPDAVTVSGYFGLDGVQPFIDVATAAGKGVFVLVRTSNPSASSIQDAALADGRKVHDLVAGELARWAASSAAIGAGGYSSIGAVVGTRSAVDAARLREAMPRSFFLVPGYGAQGGKAEDFRPYFQKDGLGALVVAGRSVIFAHERPQYRAVEWTEAVRSACEEFVQDLARICRPI